MPMAARRTGGKFGFLLSLFLLVPTLLGTPLTAQQPGSTTTQPSEREAERSDAEAFAKQFLADVMARERDKVLAAFDLEAMADTVVDGLCKDASSREAMRKGVLSKLPNSLANQLATLGSGAGTWKRVVDTGEQLHARYRFDLNSGIAFLDLVMVRDGDSWRFEEIHNRTLGVSAVAQMRNMAALMDKEIKRSALARLFGTSKFSAEDFESVQAMAQRVQAGDHAEALRRHDKLPKALQETAVVTTLRIQALSRTDNETYAKALEEAAARFPAPMFRLTLVDAHFLNQRWAKAITAIDDAMDAIDRDAALLTIRAMMQMKNGDVPGARKTIGEALQLEPECVYVLHNGLDVLLAAKDWPAVVAAMKTLEKTGKFAFRGQLHDPVWAEFRKAPESEPWR